MDYDYGLLQKKEGKVCDLPFAYFFRLSSMSSVFRSKKMKSSSIGLSFAKACDCFPFFLKFRLSSKELHLQF
jgi:hypothetical protein